MAEMREHQKTTRHLQKIHSRCREVFLCPFISPLIIAVLFQARASLSEMKVYKNFSLLSVFFFRGGLNHLPNRRQTRLMYWRQALLALGTNTFGTGDECVLCPTTPPSWAGWGKCLNSPPIGHNGQSNPQIPPCILGMG